MHNYSSYFKDARVKQWPNFQLTVALLLLTSFLLFLPGITGLTHSYPMGLWFLVFCRNYFLANIYLLKFNNENTRKISEICSKVTLKTLERRHCRRSDVFIGNFEHISHLFLEPLLLTECWKALKQITTLVQNDLKSVTTSITMY